MNHKYTFSIVLIGLILLTFLTRSTQQEKKAAKRIPSSENGATPALTNNQANYGESLPIISKSLQTKFTLSEEEARLENWKRNFPFKPIYHPTLRHDPSLYNPNDSSTWNSPESYEASIACENQRNAVFMHGFLARFQELPLRYSKEFEELYHLLGKIDRNDNPVPVAEIFTDLVHYHKAASRNPDDLITKTIPSYNEETGETGIREIPVDGKRTWGDQMKSSRESIAFKLYQETEWPTKTQMSPEKAWEWADIIIKTLPADGFISYSRSRLFGYANYHEKALKPGDPLLIPKEGYVEAYEKILRKNHRPILVNRSKDLPAVLVLGEDGQFYDEATGEPFMPGSEPILFEPGQQPVFP